MNIECLISKYGDIPLFVYGYQDGMIFFIGSADDGISINLGVRFNLSYESIVSLISKDKPIRLSHGVYDIVEVFFHGEKVETIINRKYQR